VLQHVRRRRDGDVSDADVQSSIRAGAGRRALSEEPNLAQAEGLAAIEVSGVLDSSDEFVARLRPATPADVQRVAQAYLDPANYTKVVVRS
jgi:predicted Zn-dependent peptidase